MPCVCAARKTNDHLCLGGQVIHDLAFAFIAPLGAYHNYFHSFPRYSGFRPDECYGIPRIPEQQQKKYTGKIPFWQCSFTD
jgi:hypothetical protein